MSGEPQLFKYQYHSRAFLDRAKQHYAAFNEAEDVDRFFSAVLNLRFGIEARVSEYLKIALEAMGKSLVDVPDYVASKLLKRLARANPTSESAGTVRIVDEQDVREGTMTYTPVSRELASIHGRLGAMLHYQFFVQNRYWYFKVSLKEKGASSIRDFQNVLEAGIRDLEYATSGTMLGNARFTALVEETLGESEST